MSYLLSLLVSIAVIYYGMTGYNPISGLTNKIKALIMETLVPRSEKEILIDNVRQQYNVLDRFFKESAPALLESKLLSPIQKEELKNAIQAINESAPLVEELKEKEHDERTGILTQAKKLMARQLLKPSDTPIDRIQKSECQVICPDK